MGIDCLSKELQTKKSVLIDKKNPKIKSRLVISRPNSYFVNNNIRLHIIIVNINHQQ